jgi:hypothetical protein
MDYMSDMTVFLLHGVCRETREFAVEKKKKLINNVSLSTSGYINSTLA